MDLRRKNRSEERFRENVQRLKEYNARLVVLPKKKSSQAAEPVSQLTGAILPIVKPALVQETRAITAEEKKFKAFYTLRNERALAKYAGLRQKKIDEKVQEEELSKKK